MTQMVNDTSSRAGVHLPENPHEKIIYIFDSRNYNDTENYATLSRDRPAK